MIALTKNNISIFGENSISYVKPYKNTYAVIRQKDNAILCVADRFKDYLGDIIRTMFTGESYGSGDIILVSDRNDVIYTFT